MSGDDEWSVFSVLREKSKNKRARNRETSPKVLTENGFKFDEFNDGIHLKVYEGNQVADFWPGTGLWQVDGHRGRGVKPLMDYLRRAT